MGGTNTLANGSGNGAGINASTPSFVYHDPVAATTVVGGGPATQMNPINPASSQAVDLWFKVGYNYQTNHCFIYYTIDGSNPEGAYGVGKGATRVAPAAWVNHDSATGPLIGSKAPSPAAITSVGCKCATRPRCIRTTSGPFPMPTTSFTA